MRRHDRTDAVPPRVYMRRTRPVYARARIRTRFDEHSGNDTLYTV